MDGACHFDFTSSLAQVMLTPIFLLIVLTAHFCSDDLDPGVAGVGLSFVLHLIMLQIMEGLPEGGDGGGADPPASSDNPPDNSDVGHVDASISTNSIILRDIPEDTELLNEYPNLRDLYWDFGNMNTPQIHLSDDEKRLLEEDVARRRSSRKQRKGATFENNPLECINCKKKYSTKLCNQPRLLECGHTYCTTCINNISDNASDQAFVRNFDEIRVNHSVLNLLKAMSNWTNTLFFWTKPQINDTLLKCSRCHDNYSSRLAKKTPRVFPACGHSCCELCVREQAELYGHAQCVECRTMIRLNDKWDEVFPRNHTLLDVLEVM